MRIESIEVKNFRVFKHIKLEQITPMSVFVGANGSGKSTLFDIFGFLRDALIHNVRQALTIRGGFKEVVTRGTDGPIEIEMKFRDLSDDTSSNPKKGGSPLVTYHLSIGLSDNQPVVLRELLKYRRGQHSGKPWHFLDFKLGEGEAVTNEEEYGKPDIEMQRDFQKLDSKDILAIKGLGQFQKFKIVSAFRKLIEDWHVSDFHISDARPSKEAGWAEHLSTQGENLPLVAQYMFEHHKLLFDKVLNKMEKRVPGVAEVKAVPTEDGRIVLKFKDGSFKDPFIAKYVSDGTIKMFAYLLLLHDPKPHPLLCVEEPENQLYPKLLTELAEEFRNYADRGGQVFVTTHSPELLNAVELSEIFWLTKKDGVTEIRKADENQLLIDLVKEGDLPGYLWRQGLFEGAHPA